MSKPVMVMTDKTQILLLRKIQEAIILVDMLTGPKAILSHCMLMF